MLSDLRISRLILFSFTCLCSLLQWNWNMPIIKVIEIFQYFSTYEKWCQIWICSMEKYLILFHFHCLGSLLSQNWEISILKVAEILMSVLNILSIFWSDLSFVVWRQCSGAAVQRCSYEKVFRKYAANLQENSHAKVWFQ